MIPLKDNIPSRSIPFMNYLLIAVNTAVFILELKIASYGLLENFISNYGFVPKRFFTLFPNDWFTIFSAMFLHGGWTHFFGNMLFLYIFGDNVEDRLGHFVYPIFYVLCGIGAALLQTFFSFNSNVPMIGASGAIGGVLGAYFLLYPYARILTLVFFGFFTRIVAIPAFFFLGFWFIVQMMSGTFSLTAGFGQTGGVAFWAHVGGFLTGVFWVLFFYRPKRRRAIYL